MEILVLLFSFGITHFRVCFTNQNKILTIRTLTLCSTSYYNSNYSNRMYNLKIDATGIDCRHQSLGLRTKIMWKLDPFSIGTEKPF